MISRISRFVGSYEFGDYLMQGVQATSRRSDGLGILSVIVRDCPSRVPYQGGWTIGYIAALLRSADRVGRQAGHDDRAVGDGELRRAAPASPRTRPRRGSASSTSTSAGPES